MIVPSPPSIVILFGDDIVWDIHTYILCMYVGNGVGEKRPRPSALTHRSRRS